MRITFVTVSLSAGGAERALSILATELSRRGHEVDIILFANRRTIFFECPGVKILFTEPTYSTGEEQHAERIFKLRKALIEAKSQIIISFLMLSNIYVHYAKTDEMVHIACERDDPYLIPLDDYVYVNRMVAVREADGAVFQSCYARDFYEGNLPKHVAVILNAIISSKEQRSLCDTKDNTIIAVGRIAKQKNYSLLLSAFKKFHDVNPMYTLKVYGSRGNDYDNFLDDIEKLGLADSVQHFDAIKNVQNELKKAKIFLMTSEYEGLSNSVLEAFDIGVPVVCVPLPGMLETIFSDSNNAIIVEREPQFIANAMEQLIKDYTLREKIVLNAKKTIEKFSSQNIIPQWEVFLHSVMQK